MLRHLGFVANALAIGASTAGTCRLKNATPDRLRELIDRNLTELAAVVAYCGAEDIHLYRLSSDLIPFASHPANPLPWWDEFAPRLDAIGAAIRAQGLRVSMHPGQFTVLNSPHPQVVAASIAEVAWHVRMLEALGTPTASKIVLHLGGAFGDRDAAIDRLVGVVNDLPAPWRARIVLENDERVFNVADALAASGRTGLPVIYDNLHDAVFRGPDWAGPDPGQLRAVFDTWGPADGPPKVHISTQAPGGRPGRHADDIEPDDLIRVVRAAPADRPFDAMLECKRKDLALRALRDRLRERGVVESGRLRPVAAGG